MNKNIFFAMLVILMVLSTVFTSCVETAGLTVRNDGSKDYYIEVIINGEKQREFSILPKGQSASFFDAGVIDYEVRYSTTGAWSSLLGLSSKGSIEVGDRYEIRISQIENKIIF